MARRGRPIVTVRLDPEEIERIKEAAKAEGLNVSEFIRKAIADKMKLSAK